ncbi:MAG: hypothetical protein NTV01_04170 [Bacteroidia bacterium]|nr:hypothetical protein [Bacteroidia bacterium]
MTTETGAVILTKIASAAIAQYRVVYVDSSTGKVSYADAKNAAADLVGIALSAASGDGKPVEVQFTGVCRCVIGDTTVAPGALLMCGTSGTIGMGIAQTGAGAHSFATVSQLLVSGAGQEALVILQKQFIS